MRKLFSQLLLSLLLIVTFSFIFQNRSVYAATEPADPEQIPVKVLLVIYDPILEAYSGVKLHQHYAPQGWNDPVVLANQLVTDLNTQSHGKVSYQIVQTIDRDEWPIYNDGTRYDDASYIADFNVWDDHASTWGNYNAIINDNGIVAKINNGEIDEVWMYGAPGFGWWEATTAGNGAYSTNGGPVTGVNTRLFSILGLSFKTGSENALHSYSHGTEGVMRHIYDYWSFGYGAPPAQAPAFYHSWDQFTVKNFDPGSLIGCGYVHGKMNTPTYDPLHIGTDWTNTNPVDSTCDDWSNYPYLTAATTSINCTAWFCNGYDGLKWWLSHMPYFSGSYDGYLSNWWRYFTNLDLYKNIRQINPLKITTDFAENNAASWSCTPSSGRTCSFSNDTTNKLFGVSSVKLTTNDLNNVVSTYPSTKTANWNLTTTGIFSFWVYPTNINSSGFQGSIIVKLLNSLGNGYAYTADSGLFDETLNSWRKFDIPLAGNSVWVRTSVGTPNLADVDYVEIHADTWGDSFTLTFDGLGFVTDYAETATNWACPGSTCVATQSEALTKEGINAMKLSTTSTGDATILYPSTLTANWVLTNKNIVFWAYTNNPNAGKFEGSSPKVDLLTTNSANYYRYTPTSSLLNSAINRWQRYEIPVNGNSLWTRNTVGTPSLANVDQIVIHSDTTGTSPYYVVYDGLRFESLDVTNPTVSITSPATGTTVTGIVPIKITAADNSALKRVDLLVDGVYVQTDAIAPYIISWDSGTVTNGNHTLTAKAYDMAGNLATSTTVTLNAQPDLIFTDYFQSADMSAWSSETDTENDMSVEGGIHGAYGLMPLVDNTTPMYLTDTRPINESRYRARFHVYLGFDGPTGANMTLLLGKTTVPTFGIQTYHVLWTSDYSIRTYIYNDAGTVTYGAWAPLTTNLENSIEIDWKAATAAGANDGYISLWINGVAQGTQSGIDNDTKRVEEVRFGSVSGILTGTLNGSVLDSFESRRSTYIGPVPSVIFADGFEQGNTSAWSGETDTENDLAVTSGSVLDGSWGLSALIDNTTPMYLTDTSPSGSAHPFDRKYNARFYLDPNSITMANGDYFTILKGVDVSTSSGMFEVQLAYFTATGYNVRITSGEDSYYYVSDWYPISDASHRIELQWQSSFSSNSSSWTNIFVDGFNAGQPYWPPIRYMNKIDEIQFGVVNGVDAGTAGTIYLDKFESRRVSGYIGP